MSVQLLRVPLSSPVARSIFRTSSRSLASSSFSPSFNHHQAPPPPPPSSSNRSRFRFRFRFRLLFAAAATAATAATVAHVLNDSIPTAYSAAVASPPPVDYDLVRLAVCSILDSPDHDDGSLGPILVRLAWHCSGTFDAKDKSGGSNGARMRFAPESGWNANAGLDIARRALEPIKLKFPGLSYADLYTLAGVVAIQEMGGPTVRWRPGRSDFTDGSSSPPDGRLPDAHQGQSHLRAVFYRMGFNDREIVALTGAHCLGRCHAQNSGFEGPWTRSPTTFSNNFFTHLLQEVWTPRKSSKGEPQFENSKSGKDLMMLPADLALTSDPEFRKYVELYAKDEQQFFADFAEAFAKLLELGVTFPEQNKKNSSWWPFGSSSK